MKWTAAFLPDTNAEIKKALGGWHAEWSLDRCLKILEVAREILNVNKNRIPNDTDLLFAYAANIWLTARAEHIEKF